MLSSLKDHSLAFVWTRFDDFAATHINLTLSIHLDGLFLPWHRNFVWLYEKALREECGFTGSQPYAPLSLPTHLTWSQILELATLGLQSLWLATV